MLAGIGHEATDKLLEAWSGCMLKPIASLEHDPEKWIPVFGKDHAQAKK
jgi:hypothetical protein